MYDVLTVKCPRCKTDVTFHSRGGERTLGCFELGDCPDTILNDCLNDEEPCRNCGAVIGLEMRGEIRARVTNLIGMV